ncbi:MAG: hypothetical protein HQK66_03455 [Desulfamplus sp.]|nr:hypothetical protein [Desulfamplus sp.]
MEIKQLYTMYDAGNINGCLQTALSRFHDFMGVGQEWLNLVRSILDQYPSNLTPGTLKALAQFDRESPLSKALAARLSFHETRRESPGVPGAMWFPAAAADNGFLYQIDPYRQCRGTFNCGDRGI